MKTMRQLIDAIRLLMLLLTVRACDRAMAQCKPENVPDIVQRGAAAMHSDWLAFPGFSFAERDEEISKGATTVRTYRVFMIEGTDYYMQIAFNDKPWTKDQLVQEHDKLLQELDRRRHESNKERKKRFDRYWKERNQVGILLEQYVKAIDFRLSGEEIINGHSACVLDGKSRPGYRPPNREARVLAGLRGRLWVDEHDFHWLKAEGEVLKPVSILGIVARVLPGTHMELQMVPVKPSVWLWSRFTVAVKSSIFWRTTERATVTTWSAYQPTAEALADELATPSR